MRPITTGRFTFALPNLTLIMNIYPSSLTLATPAKFVVNRYAGASLCTKSLCASNVKRHINSTFSEISWYKASVQISKTLCRLSGDLVKIPNNLRRGAASLSESRGKHRLGQIRTRGRPRSRDRGQRRGGGRGWHGTRLHEALVYDMARQAKRAAHGTLDIGVGLSSGDDGSTDAALGDGNDLRAVNKPVGVLSKDSELGHDTLKARDHQIVVG